MEGGEVWWRVEQETLCWMKRRMSARRNSLWQVPQVSTSAYGRSEGDKPGGDERKENFKIFELDN